MIGVDTATGKGRDFNAAQVIDVTVNEQVAELLVHCLPREFVRLIDRLGRWYNDATLVVERNNGGDTMIDDLRYSYRYPRLWRRKDVNDKPRPNKQKSARPLKVAPYGWFTSETAKRSLNAHLANHVGEHGVTVRSRRLHKQFLTYVRKKDRTGHDTGKTEAEEGAYDDLVMAFAIALVGMIDRNSYDDALPLMNLNDSWKNPEGPIIMTDAQVLARQREMVDRAGGEILAPILVMPEENPMMTAQQAIDEFTLELGAIPMGQGKPIIAPKKAYYRRERERFTR